MSPPQIDKSSLTFGRTGDEKSLVFCGKSPEDVNGDGLLGLVCHFETRLTDFQSGDTKGILQGKTLVGMYFERTDSVLIG